MSNIIDWIFEKLTDDEKAELIRKVERITGDVMLSEIGNGDVFKIGDIEFVKFSDNDGVTTAVAKDVVFESEFGDSNNLAESKVIERMKNEFLPKITAIVGIENVCVINTDLTTLDGLKTHGEMETFISIPTMDFYRENVAIFDKYKLAKWWWLATPFSVQPHYDSTSVVCVSPSGGLDGNYCNLSGGVRPFLRFVSSIFVSRVK